MRHSYSFALILVYGGLLLAFTPVVHARAIDISVQRASLPINLDLPDDLVPVIAELVDASPTLRAQLARIGERPTVGIVVRIDPAIRTSCRAFSVIQHKGPFIRAQVHMPPGMRAFPELFAHELEHILEQMDGLDLRELAKTKGSGVRQVDWELYETDRAQHAGRVVMEEVRLFRLAAAN